MKSDNIYWEALAADSNPSDQGSLIASSLCRFIHSGFDSSSFTLSLPLSLYSLNINFPPISFLEFLPSFLHLQLTLLSLLSQSHLQLTMTSPLRSAILLGSPAYPNAIAWSDENLIAVASGHIVTILVPHPPLSLSLFNFCINVSVLSLSLCLSITS